MKISVELSEEQLALLIKALEVNFRLMMPNQGSIAADLLMVCPSKDGKTEEQWKNCFDAYINNREAATHVLNAAAAIMYGDINNRIEIKDCHRLSDMWSAFRHLQYKMHNVRFDVFDVRSREPFRMSDYEMIKVLLEEVPNERKTM